jgi:transcriptional regulator with XRE-family HTH domain
VVPVARELVKKLDAERERQGLTKEQLAQRCKLSGASMRRLFSSEVHDVKVSTLAKIATALGASLDLSTIADGAPPTLRPMLMERLRRRSLAERLSGQTGLDTSDIEHALHNLTLSPTERLVRRFRGKHVPDRR